MNDPKIGDLVQCYSFLDQPLGIIINVNDNKLSFEMILLNLNYKIKDLSLFDIKVIQTT